jgi:transcriptional regulator with GAF, ATPase, and Fis domain
VLRTGTPWTGRFADLRERHPSVRELGFAVGCVLPLARGDRTVGVLCLRRREETLYTDDDVDFLMRVAHQVTIGVANALAYGEVRRLKETLAEERVYLRDEVRSERNFEEIIGTSPVLRRALRDAETVAPTDATVLNHGETGTGKELIARAIHNLSPRRPGTLVKLNCAAIPTGLLESELFGHEKGAFTGALQRRQGRFELADGGTIFLDEIGDMSLKTQAKVLRVLQEQTMEAVGGTARIKVDARVLAATNKDLQAEIRGGRFREDLYFRLNVIPIFVPALRDRQEDIPLLADHFMADFAREYGRRLKNFESGARAVLQQYPWPGNVRELRNVIERLMIMVPGDAISSSDLSFLDPTGLSRPAVPEVLGERRTLHEARDQFERDLILRTLAAQQGNMSRTAEVLGVERSNLYRKMKAFGIAPSRRGEEEPEAV